MYLLLALVATNDPKIGGKVRSYLPAQIVKLLPPLKVLPANVHTAGFTGDKLGLVMGRTFAGTKMTLRGTGMRKKLFVR